MKSLKTRLAIAALATLGAGAALAQNVIVPVPTSGDGGYIATGPYGHKADALVIVPETSVVVIPTDATPVAVAPAPDTRVMGAPAASTAQASTAAKPDLFRSADGTPAALGGGTYAVTHDLGWNPQVLPPKMDADGRILRGNAE